MSKYGPPHPYPYKRRPKAVSCKSLVDFIIKFACLRLGVPTPRVFTDPSSKARAYYVHPKTIVVSLRVLNLPCRELIDVILHELAHYLHQRKMPKDVARKYTKSSAVHGDEFLDWFAAVYGVFGE